MNETEQRTAPPAPAPSNAPPGSSSRGGGGFHWHGRRGFGFGILLIALGVFFLLSNLGLLDWLKWELVWPVLLIAAGVYLIARRYR
jgi:hypothetical protein